MLTAPRKSNKVRGWEKGSAMSHRDLPRIAAAFAVALSLLLASEHTASATKIKMAFPGPATTFGLPLYVAQKKG